jgi:hypothetical protein
MGQPDQLLGPKDVRAVNIPRARLVVRCASMNGTPLGRGCRSHSIVWQSTALGQA